VILRLDPDPSCKSFGHSASFEEKNFEAGDEADFIGYDSQGQHFQARAKVQSVRLADFPPAKGWREQNLEAIFLGDDLQQASGGVLCDGRGQVNAIYTLAKSVEEGQMYGFCLPIYLLEPILTHIAGLHSSPGKTLTTPVVPSLEVEFAHAELQRLRRLPVRIRPPAPWLKKLAALGDTALKVSAVATCGPCDSKVAEADLIVAIEGEVVGSVRDVDARLNEALAKVRLTRTEDSQREPFQVRLTLLRGGKEREVTVSVQLLGNDGARRVLCWQGLVLQEIPRTAREAGPVPAGVYISRQMLGSPAEADNVDGEFVVAVDGKPTPSLDAILNMDAERSKGCQPSAEGERRHLRVETADLCGRRFVTTLEPDPLFWSTFELAQDEQGAFSYREHDC